MLEAEHEWEQHHLRALVETAQRAGRSEREIRAIVESSFTPAGRQSVPPIRRARLVRRLFGLHRG